MPEPYFTDGTVALYLGDMREILPALGVRADCVVADPPYAETSLAWDRWPGGWPTLITTVTNSMWCFGSMRMFLDRRDEFTGWRLSQDLVWRKPYGTSLAADRFRRVHEHALHWYRGPWRDIHHDTPRVRHTGEDNGRRSKGGRGHAHLGEAGGRPYVDTGTRLARSVIEAASIRRGIHPTEKPIAILDLMIRYACPPGGLVVDPFAGSGSTLDAARSTGRTAIGVEANEEYIERAALRLSQPLLTAALGLSSSGEGT